MAQQNIYDDEIFFEGYKKIRDNKINANNLFEIPTLFSMLPDLKNKRILDLGCGFGEHCKRFIECGAKRVVGIDISEKMLEVAFYGAQRSPFCFRTAAFRSQRPPIF